jgi:hypothetical protein
MIERRTGVAKAAMEVRHEPRSRYDLVLNHSAARQDLVQEGANMLENGVPSDWIPVVHNPNLGNFLSRRVNYVGRVGNSRVILKPRFKAGHFNKEQMKFAGEKMRRVVYAVNSVVNEISISPKIKEVLGGEDAQRIMAQYGFERIEFVEPLLGVVDRKTGGKAVLYKFVEGDLWLDTVYDSLAEGFEETVDAIASLLERTGIYVNDLKAEQCLLSKDRKTIYLLDAEQFYFSPMV